MAACLCSPDSSTQQQICEIGRKEESRNSGEKQACIASDTEREKNDKIQNHAINSTQDVEKWGKPLDGRRRKSKLRSRFKSKLKCLNLKAYDPILELNEIDREMKNWTEEQTILDAKPLSHCIGDKKELGKDVFHIINKKEFKKLLPSNLKRYNARDVRDWCLNEIEISSDEKLLSFMKGNNYQPLNTSANEPQFNEKTQWPVCEVTNDADNFDIEDKRVEVEATKVNLPVEQGILSEQTVMKSDPELFQDIIRTPDQNNIDQLFNNEGVSQTMQRLNDDRPTAEDGATDQESTQKLAMLEMEMRARALKSFIKAQETVNKT